MYRILISCLLCLNLCAPVFAQNQTDSIKVTQRNGLKYYYKGQKIAYNDMKRIMRDHPEARENVQKANSQAIVGNLLSFTGSFMIGWTLGTSISGGDPSLPLTLAGAGILAGSIPILRSANKKALKAVNQFNSGINSPEPQKRKPIILGFSPNGISLQYQF